MDSRIEELPEGEEADDNTPEGMDSRDPATARNTGCESPDD